MLDLTWPDLDLVQSLINDESWNLCLVWRICANLYNLRSKLRKWRNETYKLLCQIGTDIDSIVHESRRWIQVEQTTPTLSCTDVATCCSSSHCFTADVDRFGNWFRSPTTDQMETFHLLNHLPSAWRSPASLCCSAIWRLVLLPLFSQVCLA